jgi:membrane protease YdiL (CAAX protease family)
VIQARLAAPRRATRVTALVLAAALLRAILLPLGDLLSTAVFAACLLAITLVERRAPTMPSSARGAGKVAVMPSIVAGLMVGAVLLAPVVTGRISARPLADFWSWAAIAAVIATLEEVAIRGALYQRWFEEAGPVAAIVAGAVVFALIHLPRYGLGAMPLDGAVGLALGGLRVVTGRVMPCAIAHTIADWAAWFWA